MELRSAVGMVGLLGALVALAFVVAPASIQSIRPIALVTDALPTDDPSRLLLAGGFLVGVGATVLARVVSSGRQSSESELVATPPEAAAGGRSTPGSAFDEQLDSDGDHASIRETLRETAVETLVRQAGYEPAAAREAVKRGTWTDDPVAAALLGDPQQSLWSRLRGWLDPDTERVRRVRRTVEALESIPREAGR